MSDVFSIDEVAVGEFVVDSAFLRSELQQQLDAAVALQAGVLRNSGYTSGESAWPATVENLLAELQSLEVFADQVRSDVSTGSQQQQFAEAGITATQADGQLTLSFDDGDDDVRVVQLPDGSLAVEVNGHQVELTDEQSLNVRIESGAGDDTITIDESVARGVTVDGGIGDDTITGGSGDDTIIGGSGDDTIIGGDGADTIEAGFGADNVDGGAGDDTIDGGSGIDVLEGGLGDDTLLGGAGNDELTGGQGNDTLDGGSGADRLSGQWGDDTIDGGSGDDTLVGGSGNDRLSGDQGADTIRGGLGDDHIRGGTGDDSLWGNAGDDTVIGNEGDDFISGSSGDDRLLGSDDDDTILGGDGEDIIYGGDGDDRALAGAGDDRVYGYDGDDELHGGSGDDTLIGHDGDDRLEGGTGNDSISGSDGADWILGGQGDDTVRGGSGEDYLEGQDGDDTIYGGDDRDIAYGGDGDDNIDGGDADDYLEGQTGDDTISGGDGDDVVSGGAGDDALDGNLGRDVVISGTGTDTIEAGAADNIYVTDDTTVNGEAAEEFLSDPTAVPDNMVIEGTPEFRARVEADLQVLASTNEGRELLDSIATSDNTITIRAQDDPDRGSTATATGGDDRFLQPDGTPGPGSDSIVRIRPQRVSQYRVGDGTSRLRTPPIVTLVHELVHAEQHVHGTMEPGQTDEVNLETGRLTGDVDNIRELDAVGLPHSHDRDDDGVADTGVHDHHDHPTENSFREELGLPPRTEY